MAESGAAAAKKNPSLAPIAWPYRNVRRAGSGRGLGLRLAAPQRDPTRTELDEALRDPPAPSSDGGAANHGVCPETCGRCWMHKADWSGGILDPGAPIPFVFSGRANISSFCSASRRPCPRSLSSACPPPQVPAQRKLFASYREEHVSGDFPPRRSTRSTASRFSCSNVLRSRHRALSPHAGHRPSRRGKGTPRKSGFRASR
ncbi:MAG: hypothetical protein RIQ93_1452 [Verrucomicrobiota bacterium]|jgi:hypothetical protein